MRTAPLIDRDLDDHIVFLQTGFPSLHLEPGPVVVVDFIAQVHKLAQILPPAQYCLNLCENRYLFMLGFCATLLRQQTNLLPPNKALKTQDLLCRKYPSTYVLHDGIEVAEALPSLNILNAETESCGVEPSRSADVPRIPLDFLAAITFTSGSTGESKPNPKTWRTFVVSTGINAKYMLPNEESLLWQLATVPGQHMWGMETSVLLPLMRRVCVCDAKPLFPQDICNLLKSMPSPRVLVSTPVHLRALTMSGIDFPTVKTILCATAPLTTSLALDSERCFDGKLQEIYGCSEVGSMSHRRTANTELWSIFDGIKFTQDGLGCRASADHLPHDVELQDKLDIIERAQFRLLGRNEDMIEIAGKRGSLAEMNKLLLSTPGVVDGAVFQPKSDENVSRIVAIVVLNENGSKADVVEKFRSCLDPVFVPRQVFVVPELPREDNGKLVKSRLLSYYQSIK